MSDDALGARKRPSLGLGRGLSALMGDTAREQPVGADEVRAPGVRLLAVASIAPHPAQPRRYFDEAALDELAASIAARGLVQPIAVRPHGEGYQIVAGERRWRAAQRARLHEIPVVVRSLSEEETLEIAIIENVQRTDLSAIEEAEAYQRLMREFGHRAEDVGALVQKSRSHVANLLRLLELPASVRAAIADGRLGMGHARALITAPDPAKLAQAVIEQGLSVRETEALARDAKPAADQQRRGNGGGGKPAAEADADISALEQQLAEMIGLKVKIVHGGSSGTVTLAYSSLDQLDMICQRLSGEGI